MSTLLTDSIKTELYKFFAVAFDAAPGVTYMSQLTDAVEAGMTVPQIVEVFTTKPQFTSVYPNFFTAEQFADKLIDTVVGSSADEAAKDEAKAEVVAALGSGMTRGEVIYKIFSNLSNAGLDSKYAGVAAQLANQVTVAQYFTEVQLNDTTDLAALRGVIAGVTNTTDVSTPAAIEAAMGASTGQTFTLTINPDNGEAFTGGAGNDTFTALASTVIADDVVPATTLGSADAIDGGEGADTFNLFATEEHNTELVGSVDNIEVINISGAKFIESSFTPADADAIAAAELVLYGSDGEADGVEGTEGTLADAQAAYDQDVADLAAAEAALEAASDAFDTAVQAYSDAMNDLFSASDVYEDIVGFSASSDVAADIDQLIAIATSEVDADGSVADTAVLQAMIAAAGAPGATVATVKAAAFAVLSSYDEAAFAAWSDAIEASDALGEAVADVSDAEFALYGSDGETGGTGSDEGTEGLLADAQAEYDADLEDLEAALAAAGRGNIDASFFGGSEQIWLVGANSDLVNVNGVATQTVGLRDVVADAVTINYAEDVTSGTIALENARGDIAVEGDDLVTLTIAGSVRKNGVNAGTINLDGGNDVKTLNLALTTDAIVDLTDIAADSSVVSTGAGDLKLTNGSNVQSITTGAGDDELDISYETTASKGATVAAGEGDNTVTVSTGGTGTTTVTTGAGEDLVIVNATNKVSINTGAGDDEIVMNRAITDNDTLVGGTGFDTLVLGESAFNDEFKTECTYGRLNELAVSGSFEALAFTQDAGDSSSPLDASKLSNFQQLEFRSESGRNIVTKVAENQTIVASGDVDFVSVRALGYVDGEAGNSNAGDLNVYVTADSVDLVLRAKHANITVESTLDGDEADLDLGQTSPDSDLDSAAITLISAVDGDEVRVAEVDIDLDGMGSGFTTLTLTGTGYATVDASGIETSTTKPLITVDASGMTSLIVDDVEFTQFTYYGQDDAKELIKVSQGFNDIEVESRAGEYVSGNFTLMDTIEGLNFVFGSDDSFDVENGSDVLEFDWLDWNSSDDFEGYEFDGTPSSLLAAVNTVAALEADNVVFQFGGATYIFAEADSLNLDTPVTNGDFEAGDMLVKLVGTYDLDDVVLAANNAVVIS